MAHAAQIVFGYRAREIINAYKFNEKKTISLPEPVQAVVAKIIDPDSWNRDDMFTAPSQICNKCGGPFGVHYLDMDNAYCEGTDQYLSLIKFNTVNPKSGSICKNCGKDWGLHVGIECE